MLADPLFDHLPPQRWRNLRRGSIVFGVLVTALLGLRLYAGHRMTRRLADAETAARAAGEPWAAADLGPSSGLAPFDNAATFYEKAFALNPSTSQGPTNAGTSSALPPRFDPRWRRSAANAAAARGPAFRLLHDAAGRADCDWHTAWAATPGSLINVRLS